MEVLIKDLNQKEQEAERWATLGELEPAVADPVEDEVLDDGIPAIMVVESEVCDVIFEMLGQHDKHLRTV